MKAIYNDIGKGYNTTRKADPYITERMHDLLAPVGNGLYVDIGCGTANYLMALAAKGLELYGVDPSEIMLERAREKNSEGVFIKAKAEHLPIADNFFNGGIAMFTIHHWDDKQAGLKEINRVLQPGGRLVFLTFTGEQMKGYWLNRYFPEMMKRSWELLPELPEMEQLLNDSGFKLVVVENYFVKEDLQDHFLYSNKRRPEQYLDQRIRDNISSFSAFCEAGELEAGLQALEQDIASGRIQEIMREYENDKGDYVFLVAEKFRLDDPIL